MSNAQQAPRRGRSLCGGTTVLFSADPSFHWPMVDVEVDAFQAQLAAVCLFVRVWFSPKGHELCEGRDHVKCTFILFVIPVVDTGSH